ncbi:hypothetical protein FAZ95_36460 [Trinickia violacea]|uniref:Uncharacterized protein n=1 Tax=Trinickia violacea TaxID=2571746 RepID=A0A4P8IYB9_9BURK|nr:hypothetical protein [Trinickia violacea]QCP54418.1 hypothetical protein FAZ95_36460 [Trinickia violacea]
MFPRRPIAGWIDSSRLQLMQTNNRIGKFSVLKGGVAALLIWLVAAEVLEIWCFHGACLDEQDFVEIVTWLVTAVCFLIGLVAGKVA